MNYEFGLRPLSPSSHTFGNLIGTTPFSKRQAETLYHSAFCIMHYAFGIALRCHYHCYSIIHCEMPVHNSPEARILSFSRSFCPYKYRRSIHSGGICQSFECLSPTDQRCRLRLHGPSGLCSGPRGRTPCPPCRPSSGSLRG